MFTRSSLALALGLAVSALPSVSNAADGQAVYDKNCKMCHASGMAGAPKFGDKAAWRPRMSKSLTELEKNAIEGFKGATGKMPARGGNPKLTDEEVKAAVEVMLDAVK